MSSKDNISLQEGYRNSDEKTVCNLLFCYVQTPFTLTLRIWDIYILEGERILPAMSYTILKLHKSKQVYFIHGYQLASASQELLKMSDSYVCVQLQST